MIQMEAIASQQVMQVQFQVVIQVNVHLDLSLMVMEAASK